MDQAEFDGMLALLYDGVLTPQGWTQALDRLASLTASQAASLVLWNRPTNQAMVGEQVGLPDELVRAYAAEYHSHDPARHHMDRIGIGEWYLDERELGGAAMRRLPFYCDFLSRYDLHSTMASPFLRSAGGLEGFISLSSSPGRRDLASVARSLAPLMPHFQRAARLRLKLDEVARRADVHQDIFDRLNFPVLVVAADARVVTANRLGSAWLEQPGNPMAAASRGTGPLPAILKAACGLGVSRRAAGVKLRKPSGSEYYLTAVPLQDGYAAWTQQAPVAMLLVSDPEQSRSSPDELLRQVFQLTPAEIRLLAPLQAGLSLKEACAQLHISPNTARTQLQSIFAKLGIRRQADIFRVLGQLNLVKPTSGS